MKYFLLSLLIAGAVYCAADNVNSHQATQSSSIVFIGKENGEILRCVDKNCSTFKTAPSAVTSLVISGDYLFASLSSGALWRCGVNSDDCKTFTTASEPIKTLAVSGGHIYTGLGSGKIKRCQLDREDSCTDFHVNETQVVTSIAASDKYLFAGLSSGSGLRWDKEGGFNTVYVYNVPVTAMAANAKYVFPNLGSHTVGRCRATGFFQCQIFYMPDENVKSLSLCHDTLYIATVSKILSCEDDSWGVCSEYSEVRGVSSIATTSGTVN